MTNAVEKEQRAIHRRAGLIAAGTLSSRVLGMIRDAVIAGVFAKTATDAFLLAFTIPNALRVLLGEGAVSGAFVPAFTEIREKEGIERARNFYARLNGIMLLILIVVSILGVLFAPFLVRLYAPGFESKELFETTVQLTRIVFPYIGLMGIAALLTGALHAHKRFFAPAFSPIWLNIALILAALIAPSYMPTWGFPEVAALAIGALAGGFLQVVWQYPAYRAIKMPALPQFRLDAQVFRALLLLVPLLFGVGVYQLNIIESRRLASELGTGAISWLFFSQRIVEIPQGMFALAIGAAALPSLAELKSKGDIENAKQIFRNSLRMSLFIAIPSSIALTILAEPTIAVIFGRGVFDAASITQTARALFWLATGVWAVASVRTIVPMFHALGDTRTPVIASAFNVAVFYSVSKVLMKTMGHAGLAVGISSAAVVQLMLLLLLLRIRLGTLGLKSVGSAALRTLIASIPMALLLFYVVPSGNWVQGGTFSNSLLYLGVVVLGAAIYLGGAVLVRSEEVRSLRNLRSRNRT